MFLIILAGIFIVTIGSALLRLNYLSDATKGDPISAYANPKSALLVIDVQNDTLGISEYGNTEQLMENINSAIDSADKNNMDILYIQQQYRSFPDMVLSLGKYRYGSAGAQLSAQLSVKSESVFSKLRADAFSVSEFEQYLIDHEISTLYLVGADVAACVYKTALGGVNRGYQVIAIENCLFSTQEQLLETMLDKYKKEGIETIPVQAFTQR